MKIDINKKYRTRDGRDVIIHAINGPDGAFPVVASVQNTSAWMTGKWRINGEGMHSGADLIEVREPREWVMHVKPGTQKVAAIYKDGGEPASDPWECIRVREIID